MAKKLLISSEISNRNELGFNEKIINKFFSKSKIKLYDRDNIPVDNYIGLRKDSEENKIDIILTFSVKDVGLEIEEKDCPVATYLLINKDSKEKYLDNKKQALIENLYKNHLEVGDGKIEIEGKDRNLNNLDEIKCTITKSPSDPNNTGRRKLKVKIMAAGEEYDIRDKNVKLFAYFNLPNKIEYDELITFPSPPKELDSFWTRGKIISACVVIGMITALIFFYREKIWSWIKREEKTKKKEQVEIF